MSKSEMFTPEEISIIQTRQLRKAIYYAYDRSPFYHDWLDRLGISPAHIKTLEDLRLLPTTSREDFWRDSSRFLCIRPEETADIMTLDHSAETPVFFMTSEADLARLAYNEQVSLGAAGLSDKDVVALAVPLDRCSMVGMAYYMGLRRIGASVLRLGMMEPEHFLRLAGEAGATAIIAPAAYLHALVSRAGESRQDLRPSKVRRLICMGDAIRDQDFSLNTLGRSLVQPWEVQLFSAFANLESSTTLCECEEGLGAHMHPELMYLEIVDRQGTPLPSGQVGEVCITPFGVTGMPVLRYRTGDLSFIHDEPCACGRQTLRLGPILGRGPQILHA